MRKIATVAIFMGSCVALGCGSGDGEAEGPDVGLDCDPVANTGCESGEKCSFLIESENPPLGRTTCVSEGNVALGDACTRGEAGPDTGFDDCVAGAFCLRGVCAQVCTATPADSCSSSDSACSIYNNLFDGKAGVCDPVCNVFTPDSCPVEDEACYLNLVSGAATCGNIAAESVQGEVCQAVNSCAEGYGCMLVNESLDGNLCAAYCNPEDGKTADGGECGAQFSDAGDARCVQVNMFYRDTPGVPDSVGMCVDSAREAYQNLRVCM